MSKALQGKIALVTGGSRGIGAAIVRDFFEEGAKVYFTYNASADEAKALVDLLKKSGEVFTLACDVRKKEDIERTFNHVIEKEGRLDILVNNAGIIRDSLFLSMKDDDWKEVFETNLGSVYAFSKLAAKTMLSQRYGKIINISSIVGELGGYGQANYAASKGAINSLTKSLAAELAARNITVNAVAPGMVSTDMSSAARSTYGDKLKERIPMGWFAEAEDVAHAVTFLASDKSRYVTGQVILVDGGLSLLGRK